MKMKNYQQLLSIKIKKNLFKTSLEVLKICGSRQDRSGLFSLVFGFC